MENFKYTLLFIIGKIKGYIKKIYYSLICALVGINKNKIVVCAHLGRNMGCNPKYIIKELQKREYLKNKLDIVWLLNLENTQVDDELKNIRIVDFRDKAAIFKELSSAKIWLDNGYKASEYLRGLHKKRGQFYLNTWHGSLGIKKMLYDQDYFNEKTSDKFKKAFDKEFSEIDAILTNSEWEENVFRSAFHYKGKFIRTGHPRNDIFFCDGKEIKEYIYNTFNIPKDKKLLLYAPSFRDNHDLSCYKLDYSRLKENLKKKFGSDWVIMSKFHPVNAYLTLDKMEKIKGDIDASRYSDIQKLMVAADVMISDYSSCMFDFLFTKKPCFIFASDIQDYKVIRDFYYPIYETPFSVSENNDELEKNILNFNFEIYEKNIEIFLKKKDVKEDGSASKAAADIVEKALGNL